MDPGMTRGSMTFWVSLGCSVYVHKLFISFFPEKLVNQMFDENVKPGLKKGKSPLDPLLLWPIGPEVFKKTFFKGKFRACSLYLYNLKTINLTHFEGKIRDIYL